MIRAGQENGEIRRDLDALAASEVYVSATLMSIRLWLTDYWGSDERLEARLHRVIDVLELGLRSAHAPATSSSRRVARDEGEA